MNNKSVFGSNVCTKECKPRWVKGKGSFTGWRLLLCAKHQIIHAMKPQV